MTALISRFGAVVICIWASHDTEPSAPPVPISSLICGIQSRENLRQDLAIARSFKPMTREEIKGLVAKSEVHAKDGKFERYKTLNYGCDWYHKHHMG